MIPGPVTAQDLQLAALRELYPKRRILRVPWDSYTPGREDDIYALTLDELADLLAVLPAPRE